MTPNSLSNVREILILKADRLCASIIQQTVLAVFPAAFVRTATTLAAAVSALQQKPVDLLLTGVALFDGDTLELLAQPAATRNFRDALVITGRREYRILSILHGLPINGVFDPTHEELAQLKSAIALAGNGGHYWSKSVLTRLSGDKGKVAGCLFHLLSPSEQLIFAVIGDGSDDSTAAERLNLRPSTVHSVRREIHRKLGVQHKGELVRLAVQHGYVRFTADGVQRPGFSGLLAACRRR